MKNLTTICAVALVAILATIAQADTLQNIQQATARVTSGNSLGSGCCFYQQADGTSYVLTNNHVAGRTGNRVSCEFWRADGTRYTTPGRVIASQISQGYVDVAVIEITPAALQSDRPTVIPLAKAYQSTSGPVSNGCPGGRWPVLFRGQIVDANADRINFYPRPGGGRSGSSMLNSEGTEIIALIAWSSGAQQGQHSLDGRSERDGNGIAMPVDTVWKVLRQQDVQTSHRFEVPISFWFQEQEGETGTGPQVRRLLPLKRTPQQLDPQPQNPEHPAPESVEPDDGTMAARGRLRRELDSLDHPQPNPVLRSARERPVLATFRVVVCGLLLLVGVVAAVMLYRVLQGKPIPKLPFLFFALTVAATAGTVTAQEATPPMQELGAMLQELSAQPVASLPMMTPNEAIEDSHASGRPSLILVQMPNCPPCEAIRDSLEKLVSDGRLNQVNLAGVLYDQPDAQRFTNAVPGASFPMLAVYIPETAPAVVDPTQPPPPPSARIVYYIGRATPEQIAERLTSLGIDTTPTPETDDCAPDVENQGPVLRQPESSSGRR